MRHVNLVFTLVLSNLLLITHLIYAQTTTHQPPASGKSFYIRVNPQQFTFQQASAIIKNNLPLGQNDQFVLLGQQAEQINFVSDKYQQYYNGIKVEHGIYKIHANNGVVNAISGEFYQIPDQLNIQPTLTKEQAVQKAIAFVGARQYKWQVPSEEAWLKKQQNNPQASYYPQGELVICKVYRNNQALVDNGGLALAYKLDIYAQEPLSRAYIYVDAHNGSIIHQNAIIKHAEGTAADGTAHTRYSGQRTVSTTLSDGTYQLRDLSRGSGVETYNMQSKTNYGAAVDFTDSDNQWTTAEFDNLAKDNAALDCHFGAVKTYDYFKNAHGRDSFDGKGAKIRCYVHYGNKFVNAFWDGAVVTFGDGEMTGSTGIQPLTTLDITAHEIAHALCEHTAGLVYMNESGAMNEGFSDIWGAMVEYYVDPAKSTWTMGEDANFTIRSMSDPNAFQHPDTYKGQYWYTGSGDNGGVHFNSGVLNHWFYLLCVGKTGVNDNGDNFSVNGIGMDKAASIAFRTETVYLTANAEYKDARTFSIQAAIDLFGADSQEAIQTANAWFAVGVYDIDAAPTNLTASAISASQINLTWTDNATSETGYVIERSASAASGFNPIDTVGADITTYANTSLVTDAVYYYRVKAIMGDTYTTYSNVASAVVGTPPVIMVNGSATLCSGRFLDPGGLDNYGDNQYVVMTLLPATTGSKLHLNFTAFDTEASYDILRIYDGPSTTSPLIGEYSGNALPAAITATNEGGQLTFYFISSYATVKAGWQAEVSCIIPPGSPGGLVASAVSATEIHLNWTDNSSDETGFLIERSVSAGTNFSQIATLAANTTSYADTELATNSRYYYRVRAARNDIFSAYSNVASAALGNAGVVMSNGNIVMCDGLFLDAGGTDNYGNYQDLTLTVTPASEGKLIQVVFSEFNTESCCDYLSVYNGATTNAPLIGSYSGYNLPPVITASNPTGQLTFRFRSDGSVAGSGWQARLSCVEAAAPVIQHFTPTRGRVGTSVVITGSNFRDISRIQFNNTPASVFTVDSDHQITAVVPAEATEGNITITTAAGTAFSTSPFIVTAPAITHFSPASGAVGTAIVITGADFEDVSSVTFNGIAAEFAFNSSTQITAIVPPEATTGPVSIRLAEEFNINSNTSFTVLSGISMSRTKVTTCNSIFRDAGGSDGYANNADIIQTFKPATAGSRLQASFTAFDTEASYDILRIYDGPSTTSPLIGEYSGSALPAAITATNEGGQLTFYFTSNHTAARAGWEASLICVEAVAPVVSSMHPGIHARHVAPYSDITVSFSQPMHPSAASLSSIKIHGSQSGLYKGSFSGAAPDKAIFDPASDLKAGEVVTVSITSQAKSLSGVAIAVPQVYQFTAGAAVAAANFVAATVVALPADPIASTAADFDGNGDIDIATANNGSNTVSVSFNNGKGVFSDTKQLTVGEEPAAIAAADLDSDGDVDLAVANKKSNTISLSFNNGKGVFSGTTQLTVGEGPAAITAADFDGDGDMDLAVANSGSNTVSVSLNNGTGEFTATSETAIGIQPSAIAAADFDGDGDMDLAVANSGSNTVSVSLNNGTGEFTATAETATGLGPQAIIAADFDGDAAIDIAVANSGSNTVSVRFNNGKGEFTTSAELTTGIQPSAIAAADFDGDGDMDLAVANAGAGTLTVGINNGTGEFTATSETATGLGPQAIIAADFDNDRDIDLATADFTANTATLLFNSNETVTANPDTDKEGTADKESKVYPNPFKNELNLLIRSGQKEEVVITITDVYGKVVYHTTGKTTNQEIKLNNELSSGMYILQASYGNKVKLFKIIKHK